VNQYDYTRRRRWPLSWFDWLVGSKEGFVVLIYIVGALMLGWPIFALLTGRIQ
jgi:hypothetical protein